VRCSSVIEEVAYDPPRKASIKELTLLLLSLLNDCRLDSWSGVLDEGDDYVHKRKWKGAACRDRVAKHVGSGDVL
jgi:hypothetical protein